MTGLSDIADYMFSNPTLLNLTVQGMWLASRMFSSIFVLCSIGMMTNAAILTEDAASIEAPSVNFVHKNLNVFPFKSFPLIKACISSSHILLFLANLSSLRSTKLPINATITLTSRST